MKRRTINKMLKDHKKIANCLRHVASIHGLEIYLTQQICNGNPEILELTGDDEYGPWVNDVEILLKALRLACFDLMNDTWPPLMALYIAQAQEERK